MLDLKICPHNCLMNRAKLGLFLSYKKCICFIIGLDLFICFGVCCCEFWGLVYVKWDTLDMTM